MVLEIIGLSIGTGGLAFGLYQYFITQKWKKSEFAASQIEKLFTNPVLSMCSTCLDWSPRKIQVPEDYKYIISQDILYIR